MNAENRIVLTEFPKSGGSWIASMLGEALQIPVRDIYVQSGFEQFEVNKHPWYANAPNLDIPIKSIVKSHELPNSALIDFEASYTHLVRDGRDVTVSKWFFEKNFCVQNNITNSFNKNFDEYVNETAQEWSNYVNSWAKKTAILIKYEDFLANPAKNLRLTLEKLTDRIFTIDELEIVVSKYTKENFSASLDAAFSKNTFVRKGVSGDWRNHFSDRNSSDFKRVAGKEMLLMGYHP